jgi:AcrR family transcriptional regulator
VGRRRAETPAVAGKTGRGRRPAAAARRTTARIPLPGAGLPRHLAPRKPPSQNRSRATVEAILEAAAELLAAPGRSASTNRIAARAGVSVGSLYQYFPGKDAIVAALFERHAAAVDAVVASAFAEFHRADVPLRGAFRRLLTGLQVVHDADPRAAEAVSPYVEGHQQLAAVVRRREERFQEELVDVLRGRPDVRRGNHRLMAALLFDIVDAVTRSLMHGDARRFDRADALTESVEAICRYLDPQP